MKPITLAMLKESNISEPLKALVQEITAYAAKYECTLEEAIDDFDYPLAKDLRQAIVEVAKGGAK